MSVRIFPVEVRLARGAQGLQGASAVCGVHQHLTVPGGVSEGAQPQLRVLLLPHREDDLSAAYLERTNRQLLEWMEGLIAAHQDPRAAMEAVFEGVAKLASSPECLGCAFVGAAAEFPDLDHPGHRAALDHKRAVVDRLRDLAEAAGARDTKVMEHLPKAEQALVGRKLRPGVGRAERRAGSGRAEGPGDVTVAYFVISASSAGSHLGARRSPQG